MSVVEMRLGDVVMYGGKPQPQRGCYIVFSRLTGWWDGVGGTGETVQNQFSDGAYITPSYDESRSLVVEGSMWADDQATLRDGIAWFKSQVPKSELGNFVAVEHDLVSHTRVRRDGAPLFPWDGGIHATFSIQLVAPKARKLGGDGSTPYQSSAAAYLPSTVGGLQLPVSAPFSIGATVIGNSVTVAAQGNARPPVLVRIDGPVVQPIIRDGEGGQMVLAISLDAGQWLDVDLDARTIKINSQVSRRNVLRGQWITPRAGMTLSLDAAVYNPDASMTVSWTDASY